MKAMKGKFAKGTVKGRSLPRSAAAGKVMPASGLADKGKVLQPYDVDMNITDAAKNMDKFYRMQVVESTDKTKYWFALHYGRNGSTGQKQVKGPTNQVKAVKMMEQKFKQKTGKAWADRGSAAAGTANSAARSGKGHYELTARLKKAGAKFATKKGAVAISLMWDHQSKQKRNDLDLWVTAPSGEKIGFSHQQSACKGELDVDRRQDAAKPVENIVWIKNAPKGNYTVKVHNFSMNHNKAMPFKVGIVRDGGDMELIEKVMPAKDKAWVAVKKFKYA